MKKLLVICLACIAAVASLPAQTLNITAPGYSGAKLFDSTPGFTISGLGADAAGNLYYLQTDARFSGASTTLYKREASGGYASATALFSYNSPLFGAFVVINTGKIYFAESSTGSIRSINPDGTGLAALGSVTGVYDLAFSGLNAFVSANSETDFTKPPRNKVSKFDLATGLTDAIVDTGGDYSGPIDFDGAGNLLYGATDVSTGGLSVPDLHSFSPTEIASAFGPTELALAPPNHRLIANGKNVYLAFAGGTSLWKDDFTTLTLHDLATTGSQIIGTSDPDQSLGHLDFAAGQLFANVTSFSAARSSVYSVIPIPEPSPSVLSIAVVFIAATHRFRGRWKRVTEIRPRETKDPPRPTLIERRYSWLPTLIERRYNGRPTLVDRRYNGRPTLVDRRYNCPLLLIFFSLIVAHSRGVAGPFDRAAGQPGSNAITRDDPRIVAWGTAVGNIDRGLQDANDAELGEVTYGVPTAAVGPADAQVDSYPVVSLGDGGWIEMLFGSPITDRAGPDFAVFENGITDTFLELAFVEVSDDGVRFVRFPAISFTPATSQIDPFGALDATNLYNLAGKYRRGFGTPFDLAELSPLAPWLDIKRITRVRIVDVVGSIDPRYASFDSAQPTPHMINDPWPTAFETGGFDLDAIAVLHQIPESATGALTGIVLLGFIASHRSTRSTKKRASRVSAPRSMPRERKTLGFTMVELLLVLTILSVLVTILLAGVNGARARSDAARCMGNLRQLALANITYAAEHDGQYVAAQEPTNTVRWHGVRGGVEESFDPTRGPLAPYLGAEQRVKLCPALRSVLTGSGSFEEGTGGYGYNAIYIGGTPADRYTAARMSHVGRASRTIMFTDTGFPRKSGLQEYAYCEPWEWVDVLGRPRGRLFPTVHFRHSGLANVAWCDGHVTAESPSEYGKINQYGGDATRWKIGWFGPRAENGFWKP